jgi:hypothetical protein
VSWAGFALAVVAVFTLAGKRIPLPDRRVRASNRRGIGGLLLFGAGYGVASLTNSGGLAALLVFAGYAVGIAVVLTALAVGVGLLRDGITRALTSVLPPAAVGNRRAALPHQRLPALLLGHGVVHPCRLSCPRSLVTAMDRSAPPFNPGRPTAPGPGCSSARPASSS